MEKIIPYMARDHGFHAVRITRIIQETADTRTYVLDAHPPPHPSSLTAPGSS
jgi:hypothetical protein